MAFPERGWSRIMLALLIYAGSLEFLQRFSPGRTSHIGDFVFSSVGVVAGVFAFALANELVRAGRPKRGTN
jgi:VanZ family protein